MIEASSIIRIGGVSIDVSHPKAFASNLEKYCMNMRYALEYDDGFRTKQELEWFKNRYGLDGIAQSIEEMAGQVDVGFIQSCNWDKHLDQAMPFIREGKPVFIDKPIVGSSFLAIKTEAFCEQGEFRRNVDALIDEHHVELRLDLKPSLSVEQLNARFEREKATLSDKAPIRHLLAKLVPSLLIGEWARRSKLDPTRPIQTLTATTQRLLIDTLKSWRITIVDYASFREAIVTAGGVCTDEVNPMNMQSKLIRGLYFAGEVLDIDANTGGYNLQIAYSTGHLAGKLNP